MTFDIEFNEHTMDLLGGVMDKFVHDINNNSLIRESFINLMNDVSDIRYNSSIIQTLQAILKNFSFNYGIIKIHNREEIKEGIMVFVIDAKYFIYVAIDENNGDYLKIDYKILFMRNISRGEFYPVILCNYIGDSKLLGVL